MSKNGKRVLMIAGMGAALAVIAFVAWSVQQRKPQGAIASSTPETVTVQSGPLTASVGATGQVRTQQEASIVWQTSGTVASVSVSAGDSVKAGQTLATLADASLSAPVLKARSDLIQAQTDLETLKVSTVSQAQAYQTLVDAQAAYHTADVQRNNLDFWVTPAAKAKAYADYTAAEQVAELAQQAFDGVENREPSDSKYVVKLSNLSSAKQARDQALMIYNLYSTPPTAATIAQFDANLAVAKAKLDEAQRNYDRLKNGPTADDLTMAEAKVAAAEATASVDHLVAPFDGTITTVDVMPGDTVSKKSAAFQMDDLTHLYLDANISEVDINQVATGQNVNITFDAMPTKAYAGKVVTVLPLPVVSGSSTRYTVSIEISQPDAAIHLGMTAGVEILVSELKDVLQIPNESILTVNGVQEVYKVVNGQVTAVPVTLGVVSDLNSQVLTGDLKAGDTILSNPSSTQQNQSTPSPSKSFSIFDIFRRNNSSSGSNSSGTTGGGFPGGGPPPGDFPGGGSGGPPGGFPGG